MNKYRQISGGLLITLFVIIITVASLYSAMAESQLSTMSFDTTTTGEQEIIEITSLADREDTPEALDTASSPATSCSPPAGWKLYVVQQDDTIAQIANLAGISPEELAESNCLIESTLVVGGQIYTPVELVTPTESTGVLSEASSTSTSTATATRTIMPSPISQNTAVPCGPPAFWVLYTVKAGDTLYSLAAALDVTVYQLQFANCLGGSTLIRTNEKIWVPFIPTPTPTPTASATTTATPTSSATPTATATITPTIINTSTATVAATDILTSTATLEPTQTLTHTSEPVVTNTELPAETPTATDIPQP